MFLVGFDCFYAENWYPIDKRDEKLWRVKRRKTQNNWEKQKNNNKVKIAESVQLRTLQNGLITATQTFHEYWPNYIFPELKLDLRAIRALSIVLVNPTRAISIVNVSIARETSDISHISTGFSDFHFNVSLSVFIDGKFLKKWEMLASGDSIAWNLRYSCVLVYVFNEIHLTFTCS